MSGEDEIIVGGVVADQAAAEAAEAARAARRKRRTAFPSPTEDGVCSNCGTQLKGLVCHSCGQSADEFHRPVWQLFSEVADGLFGVEGRLWRTVPAIVFRPGHVTKRYLSGVRMRYVQPFRLYLAASVLFFLVAFFGQEANFAPVNVAPPAMSEEQAAQATEGLEQARAELEAAGAPAEWLDFAERGIEEGRQAGEEAATEVEMNPVARAALQEAGRERAIEGFRCEVVPEDCTREELDAAEEDGVDVDLAGLDLPVEFRRFLVRQFATLVEDPGEMLEELQTRAPQAMFFLLPIFALLLALTHFWKRGYFFYDHLIVSLHFHSFVFFFLTILIFATQLVGAGWTSLAAVLWSNFYLYRLHRRVYQHGRISSVLRTFFIDLLYLIVLVVASTIYVLAAVLLM